MKIVLQKAGIVGVIVLAGLLPNPSRCQTWQDLGDVSGNAAYRHDDVWFVSPTTGYTVYYNAGESVKRGTIYKTTDGGASWNVSKNSDGTHFRCIAFMDAQTGIAGNLGKGSFDNTTDTIPFYRTTDGGQTWVGTNPAPETVKGICALQKVNENVVYAAGRVRGPAHLLKSFDKGATWQIVDLLPAGLGAAMDLYFPHPDTGFVVGMDDTPYASGPTASYKGKIIYTTNGGQTWTTVLHEPLNPTYFWKINFPTRQTGYATLQQNTATYQTVVYYKTTNGGQEWIRNEIPTSLFGQPVNFLAQGIGFVDENRGWIGGGGFATNFIETLDGGQTWSNLTSEFSYRVNKIRTFGEYAYAAGIRIHRFFNPMKTNEMLANSEAVSVYPNPVSHTLYVKLKDEFRNEAEVSLHRVTGEKVLGQIVQNEAELPMEALAAGVYFLRVSAGQKFWIRRIVKE